MEGPPDTANRTIPKTMKANFRRYTQIEGRELKGWREAIVGINTHIDAQCDAGLMRCGQLAQGEFSGFCPVSDVDLGVEVGNMTFHSALAEDQFSGDLAVGLPLR